MALRLSPQKIPYLALPIIIGSLMALATGWILYGLNVSYHNIIQQEFSRFDKLRSIVAFKDAVSKPSDSATLPESAALFFSDGTPAIVTAQLLTNLKNIAASHGLEVLRAADLPAKVEGPLNMVVGSLDLSGPIPSVFALIQDIENAKPALFIEKLDLHASSIGAIGENTDTILTVSIQVSGAAHMQNIKKALGGN
jgi:Type II secretion system (T2SS), protein M subtype b